MENLYMVAVLPPMELTMQIQNMREECANKYNVKAALKPPVHITLRRPFKLAPNLEYQLLRALSPASVTNAFRIELENFGSFHIHTLYINVLKNKDLTVLYRKIASVFTRHKFDPREFKTSNNPFSPHITIAYRDIPAETFPDIWKDYKDRKFKRHFVASAFTVLKHDGREWRILREFEFKEEPETLTLF